MAATTWQQEPSLAPSGRASHAAMIFRWIRGNRMATDINILLCSQDTGRQRFWRQSLAGHQLQLWDDTVNSRHAAQFDILLVDATIPPASRPLVTAAQTNGQGVVAIGLEVPADVTLATDHTLGELQLACQLLGEIVRLRRQQQIHETDRSKLESLALTDHLTQLGNRRAWDEELERRSDGFVAIIDLDHFKKVNGQQGYAAGDELLRQVAAMLRKNTRDNDFLARLGGDEFGLFLNGSKSMDGFAVVDRIRKSVANILPSECVITASAGFAKATQEVNPSSWVEAADRALRQAKARGRDRTVEADS